MATPDRQLRYGEMHKVQPDPVITYDHMNSLEHKLYMNRRERVQMMSRTSLVCEAIIIAVMFSALLVISL